MYDYSFVERVSILLLFEMRRKAHLSVVVVVHQTIRFYLIFSTIFASAYINLVRLSLHCLQHLLYALVVPKRYWKDPFLH